MTDPSDSLEAWTERLSAIARNSSELSDAELCKRIKHRLRGGFYTGLTREKAELAVELLSALSDDYLLLANLIDEAQKAAKPGLFESSEAAAQRVRRLLESASIERCSGVVAIQQRSLLGDTHHVEHLSPSALVQRMSDAFSQAQELLTTIDAAEAAGSQAVSDLKQSYAALQDRSRRLQAEDAAPPLVSLDSLSADPLAFQKGVSALERSLASWSQHLSDLEAARGAAQAQLDRATSLAAEMEGLGASYSQLTQELMALYGSSAQPASKGLGLTNQPMLADWLGAIQKSAAMAEWRAVMVGLERLLPALQAAVQDARKDVAALRARHAEVSDLQGQFRALKAMASGVGLDSHSASYQAARREVESALEERPLNLHRVQQGLKAFRDLMPTH